MKVEPNRLLRVINIKTISGKLVLGKLFLIKYGVICFLFKGQNYKAVSRARGLNLNTFEKKPVQELVRLESLNYTPGPERHFRKTCR